MLTRKGKYGLKAMIALAKDGGDRPVLIGDLAEREAIPKKFLENILLALKHRGLGRGKLYPDLFEALCGVVCAPHSGLSPQ